MASHQLLWMAIVAPGNGINRCMGSRSAIWVPGRSSESSFPPVRGAWLHLPLGLTVTCVTHYCFSLYEEEPTGDIDPDDLSKATPAAGDTTSAEPLAKIL